MTEKDFLEEILETNEDKSDKEKAQFLIDNIENSVLKNDLTWQEYSRGLKICIATNQFPNFLNTMYNAFKNEAWLKNKKKKIQSKLNHHSLQAKKRDKL